MKIYIVSYVGLSESEYAANGYCDNYLFSDEESAKAKVQDLKEEEIAHLVDNEEEYEILEDSENEVRIGWCGNTEQVRIKMSERELA